MQINLLVDELKQIAHDAHELSVTADYCDALGSKDAWRGTGSPDGVR
jgi:hypothetical protein